MPIALPAPDVVPCCDASANTGGDSCTCWRPIHAEQTPAGLRLIDQQQPLQEGPPCARRRACDDCAYRAGSPERDENDGDIPAHNERQRFYCHDGMPLVIGWRHPSGALHTIDPAAGKADYDARIQADRAFRVDGRPAVLCAGWAAINRFARPDPAVDR